MLPKEENYPEAFKKAIDEIVFNLYVANVNKRLRELSNPNDTDCQRWPWELIQNAKDTISQDKDRKHVNVTIEVNGDEVKFIHDGRPFSSSCLMALLFKFSKGKEDNSESTGRFGTGFLTTHALSKTVSIECDLHDENSIPYRFRTTMYREGESSKEFLDGVKKMKESFEFFPNETKGTTIFTYHLLTQRSKEACRLGIENFKTNIVHTLLFCKEVHQATLNENGIVTTYTNEKYDSINQNFGISTIHITGNQLSSKCFLCHHFKEHSNELSKLFGKERDLRVTIAVEFDEYKGICNHPDIVPSLFCVLPLVGSELFVAPMIINSPDFEPTFERKGLHLSGDSHLEDTRLSNTGVNQLILSKSIQLYKELLDYLKANDYKNLFILSRGLKDTKMDGSDFSKKWHVEHFINPLRAIISECEIIPTNKGMKNVLTTRFPDIIDGLDEVIKLMGSFGIQIPDFSFMCDWKDYFWDTIHRIGLEEFVKMVSQSENTCSFLNELCGFLIKSHDQLIFNNSIVKNQNGKQICIKSQELYGEVGIPDILKDILKNYGIDWRENHIHKEMTNIELTKKHSINDCIHMLQTKLQNEWFPKYKNIKEYKLILQLLPEDENIDGDHYFIRKGILELICGIFNEKIDFIYVKNLPKSLWENSYQVLIPFLMNCFRNSNGRYDVTLVNKAIKIALDTIGKRNIEDLEIFPNKKQIDKKLSNLKKNIIYPLEINQILIKKCNFDIDDYLIHEGIDCITNLPEFNHNELTEKIMNCFEYKRVTYDFMYYQNKFDILGPKNLNLAIELMGIKTQMLNIVKHDAILSVWSSFSNKIDSKCIDWPNSTLWETPHLILTEHLVKVFLPNKSLESLKNTPKEDYFKFLECVFTQYFNDPIYPNQLGNFVSLNTLKTPDSDMPQDLISLYKSISGIDLKVIFIHPGVIPNQKCPIYTTKELCGSFSIELRKQYNKKETERLPGFKESCSHFIYKFLDENSKIQETFLNEKSFVDLLREIEINVLSTPEQRKKMIDLNIKYNDQEIVKLIENPQLIHQILNVSDEKMKEIQIILNSNDRPVNEVHNYYPNHQPNNPQNYYPNHQPNNPQNYYHNYHQNYHQNYQPPIDPIETEFIGEAIIYGELMNSGLFNSVKWLNRAQLGYEIETPNGKKYFVSRQSKQIDIEADKGNGTKYLFCINSSNSPIDNDSIKVNGAGLVSKPNEKLIMVNIFDVRSRNYESLYMPVYRSLQTLMNKS